MTTPLLAAAVVYASLGWRVFPLRPRHKIPYGNTVGFVTASADADLVGSWWRGAAELPRKDLRKPGSRAKPDSNVGVATGPASGFWVLDIDGPEAAAALEALEQLHGRVPPTVRQLTGKGSHYLFRWPSAETGILELGNSASRIGKGIDVRGDGGYIVVAPSIHPSGRAYAWAPGCAPGQVEIADAPAWLLALTPPPEPAPAAPSPRRPHQPLQGRATAYGEAALTNACRRISGAPDGAKNQTLWLNAIAIGRLTAGDEIADAAYALDALREAGRQMCHWSKREEDTLSRGFDVGLQEPRSAPERRGAQAARLGPSTAEVAPEGAMGPADAASATLDAMQLWQTAFHPRSAAAWPVVRAWFAHWGLDPDWAPGGLERLRFHPNAPWNHNDASGPALIAKLTPAPGAVVEAVAVLPLHPRCRQFALFLGEAAGKAVIATSLEREDPSSPLIVALDLQDGWRLCADAIESGLQPRLALCPTIRSFAGAAMGDRYGRVDPDMPQGDPAHAPWTWPDAGEVLLAVRRDLRPVEIRSRKFAGGTMPRTLSGEAAARFWGSLAEQAWRRAGANPVRILQPSRGDGFHDGGVA